MARSVRPRGRTARSRRVSEARRLADDDSVGSERNKRRGRSGKAAEDGSRLDEDLLWCLVWLGSRRLTSRAANDGPSKNVSGVPVDRMRLRYGRASKAGPGATTRW